MIVELTLFFKAYDECFNGFTLALCRIYAVLYGGI